MSSASPLSGRRGRFGVRSGSATDLLLSFLVLCDGDRRSVQRCCSGFGVSWWRWKLFLSWVVFLVWVFRGGLASGGGSGLPFVVVVCRGVCSCGVRIGNVVARFWWLVVGVVVWHGFWW